MTEAAGGRRAANRARVEREILEMAGQHLARDGAAALSLRAIARDLGMASSAVYRYVESRDELLTRLIIEAYTDLGDEVDAALDGVAEPRERFRVIARVVRSWAIRNPEDYALVYGSPVPGYEAPGERTTEAGTRVTQRLLEVLAALPPARRSQPEMADHGIGGLLADPQVAQSGVDGARLTRGLAAWATILGAVSAELFGRYGPEAFSDPAAHFDAVVELALGML